MRIVHVHKEFDLETGGVVRAILDLCQAMAGAGHDVTIATTDARDVPDAWKHDAPGRPHVVVVPSASPKALTDVLHDAEVVHLHGMWSPYNDRVARYARRLGVPYIYTVHGMLDDWCMAQRGLKKRVYLAAVARSILHDAAAVHCTAEAELEQARKWFPKGNGVVIPLIFDASSFEILPGPELARDKYGLEPPTVLFLSRLHYKKGVEHVVGAAAELPDVRFAIAGTGDTDYERTLRDLSTRLGVDDRVSFVGFVSGTEKISLYQAADVFLLPTSQENFGFVLFEALAAGTPLITTEGADTWPELEASGGAAIVRPGEIVATLRSLLADEARRVEMGRAGRAWVLEHLSGERIVAQYEALYATYAAAGDGHAVS